MLIRIQRERGLRRLVEAGVFSVLSSSVMSLSLSCKGVCRTRLNMGTRGFAPFSGR